jgi:trafficking protein particle complex subunit 11
MRAIDFTRQPGWHYDITRALDDVKVEQPPVIKLSDEHITSFISSSFAFKNDEGRAGQTVPAQLSINSRAFDGSPALSLNEIRIDFEGSLRPIILKPASSAEFAAPTTHKQGLVNVLLKEVDTVDGTQADEESSAALHTRPSVVLQGECDLTVRPSTTHVFQMNLPLREAGEAKASAVQVTFAPGPFTLKYTMRIKDVNSAGFWHTPLSKRVVTRLNPHNIKVLPRPPKMEVKFVNVARQYYAGEPIRIEVAILNEEDVDAITKLDVHLYGQDVPSFAVQTPSTKQASNKSGEEGTANGVAAGPIASSGSVKAAILVEPIDRPTAYDLTVRAWYNLVSDPGTPIVQIVAFQINVVNPFEASYDLVPRLHSDAWPSVFDPDCIQDSTEDKSVVVRAQGLAQKWCLITRFGSFATEDLIVQDLDLQVIAAQGGVTCTTSKNRQLPAEGVRMSPKTMEEANFDLVAQKLSLDDRSPSTADLSFAIKWKRSTESDSSAPLNSTVFQLDPFYVTVAEPRVIATVSYSPALSGTPSQSAPSSSSPPPPSEIPLIFLDISIENPSAHFLTFGVSMEPSDQFAFSGSKAMTLNVLPVARRTVTYRLLPLVTGTWIKPVLVVRDKYFQKVLKIIPTRGMKRDGDGVAIWVPGLSDDGQDERNTEEANDA